jgi:hypothetical protein
MQGRAEFLAPETLMVPRRGFPPRTTNLSIVSVYERVTRKWVLRLVQTRKAASVRGGFVMRDKAVSLLRGELWSQVAAVGSDGHGSDAWIEAVAAGQE